MGWVIMSERELNRISPLKAVFGLPEVMRACHEC